MEKKKIMDKQKYFIETVCNLCGKLKVKRPLLKVDNRLGRYCASVTTCIHTKTKETRFIMRYNMKIIDKLDKWEITHLILHELGHIRTDAKTEEEREYKAEKFALKATKKYYPKQYKRTLRFIEWYVSDNKEVYRKAFKRLLLEANEGKL